jgi:hypothetical protein
MSKKARNQDAREPAQPADAPPARRKRFRRTALAARLVVHITAGLVLVAFIGYIVLTQWLAKPETIRALAASRLAKAFPDKNVKVGAASFSIVTGLNLYGVELADKDTGAAVVRLGEAHVDLDYGSILEGKVTARNARALDLFVDLVRREDGTWNVTLPAPSEKPGRFSLGRPFSAQLESAFVSFDDRKTGYSISFPIQNVSAMSGGNGLSQWRAAANLGAGTLGVWRLSATGDAAGGSMEARFAVAGLDSAGIEYRLPPSARKAYRLFEPSGPMDLQGRIAYARGGGWDWTASAALRGVAIVFRKFPVPMRRLEGEVVFAESGYSFKDLEGEAGGGRVSLSGGGGYSGDSAVAVTLAGEGLVVDEELLSSLPRGVANAVRPFHPAGIGDFDATVTRADGPKMPVDVAADIRVRDMKALYDAFPLPLNGLHGRVVYAGHAVEIDGLAGRHGETAVTVNGTVANIRTGRPVRTEVSIVADGVVIDEELLSVVPEKVADAMRAFNLAGTADVAANVAKTSGEPLSLDLAARLEDASIFHKDFPYQLSQGAGELAYSGGMLRLDGLAFRHGGARIDVSGSASMADGATDLVIAGRGVPVEDEVMQALPEPVTLALKRVGVTGVADADVTIGRGADGRLSVGGVVVRLHDAQFMEPSIPIGVGGADCEFAYEDGRLAIHSIDGGAFTDNVSTLVPFLSLAAASLPPSRVKASGRVPLAADADRGWSMAFEAERLFIDTEFIDSLPEAAGDALLRRDIHGCADCSGKLDYSAGEPAALDFDLDVLARGLHATVIRELTDISGRVRLAGGWRPGASAFTIEADLKGFRTAGIEAGATRFVMRKTEREAFFDRFSAEVVGGIMTGEGRFAIEEDTGYGFTADLRGLDLKTLLAEAFSYSGKDIAGRVDGHIKYMSPGGRPGDAIGSASATISEGTLWEVPFILGVLDVLKLQLPERQSFRDAEIRAEISERRLLVDEFSMSSDSATLYGRGIIGLDGKLDLTFYAQPGRIPIISLIAGQVGKNIVRAHVGGTFEEPEITLIPSGLLGGVLDWIKRPLREVFGGGR